ncbi:JAB N-terminal domain-containing protein [Frankia sp. QA3]|uniref:JAB N-terminal domain-containing protein n=1 Tax=Frankia sp. QA3 TaxID=710111 RepID=UPI000269C51A|nr:JAB N-terminal domain-containing protein [Frankia sp. QA3]EIV94374.1 hypothetical protein FraQA3DRAFT_4126 [Frankia sp. QA3]
MSVDVELYRSDDYVRTRRVKLMPLLRPIFEWLLGESLEQATFRLAFLPVPDHGTLDGEPSVRNLRGSHGYVHVRIVVDGELRYQHPHALREIVARPLQQLLAEEYPAEKHWGFGIVAPGLEHIALVRPTPPVGGLVEITTDHRRPAAFHVEEIPDPEPPAATLRELGVLGEGAGPRAGRRAGVGVVFDGDAYAGLIGTTPFSTDVEEGGFLAGRVYRWAGHPQRYLVHVTEAVAAQRTGASLLQFTFTGDSFLRINSALAQRPDGERLAGWYHTHLFAASAELGLSSIDVDLHQDTFRRPWQIAALINIHRGRRVLRCYYSEGDEMRSAPFWIGAP